MSDDYLPFVESVKTLDKTLENSQDIVEKTKNEIFGEFDLLKEANETKIFENDRNNQKSFYDYVIKGGFLKTLTPDETLLLFNEKNHQNKTTHGFRSNYPDFKTLLEVYEKVCFLVCEFKFKGLPEFYAIGFPYFIPSESFEQRHLETGFYSSNPATGVFEMIGEVHPLDYHINLINYMAICEKILYNREHIQCKTQS
jgi:hypothetical protein